MDKTSFWWTGLCAICHPGGGPSERDRDGELYYDVTTGRFGYENLGLTAAQVTLDGDYAEINPANGALRAAPWDVTGVAEPDCLFCHRRDRAVNGAMSLNWVWRTATLRAKDGLVTSGDVPVPAYAAAATAAQGWFRSLALKPGLPAGTPPLATSLDLDYQVGVDGGSLVEEADGTLRVSPQAIQGAPKDFACWGCHITPDLKKRGRVWFDPTKDVHYAGFNRLVDPDPTNDVVAADSTACTRCHPAGVDHDIAKGNATLGSVRNDTDYAGFRTCRECHLGSSPDRDPEAPPPTNPIHTVAHLDAMSCEFCHVPYKHDPADLVVDNSLTGSTVGYNTARFLSEDPLDPTRTDGDARWWPAAERKTDHDGVTRLFPTKLLLSAWWGDWDRNGTPEDLADDVVRPIPLWRVRGILLGPGAPTASDDNGDGTPEVNTHAEIRAFIAALRANDVHGHPVAANPVLVKGGRIWFDDGVGGVGELEFEGTPIQTESSHPFSINHNVLPPSEALGNEGDCADCHRVFNGGLPVRVFDRLVPVDPWQAGQGGAPRYVPLREVSGVDPE